MTLEHSPKQPPARAITVKDIARISRTSASTVSRVLTGAAPVADDKREAVERAIAASNFRPNLLARSLKTRATHSIGLLINDILNPFYGALARGVEDRASDAGYAVIFCNTNEDPDRELSYLSMLRDKSVDGIILAPTGANASAMADLILSGTALVQVDRKVVDLDAASVTVNNDLGGYLAAEHLLGAHHEDIAFVTYQLRQSTVAQREQGYLRAMADAGLSALCTVCSLDFDLADTRAQLAALFAQARPPSALIAANNRIAIAALHILKDLNIRIGYDLALVVFDDLEIFELMNPALTAVSQPAYAMGRRAADFLIAQLMSGANRLQMTEVFEPVLVVRESSKPVPIGTRTETVMTRSAFPGEFSDQ